MKLVFSLKKVKITAVLTVLLLLVTAMIPQEAQAFVYTGEGFAAGVPSTDALYGPKKIGNGYFYHFSDYISDPTVRTLYYLASPGGQKVKLATVKGNDNYLGWTILFDGNKVYYETDTYQDGKHVHKIYSVNKNGSGRKLLKTIKTSRERVVDLLSIHNGRLYYNYNKKLYSINLKTGESGLREAEFKFIMPDLNLVRMGGNGRYLMGCKSGSNNDYSLKIYDCETLKCTVYLDDEEMTSECMDDKYLYYEIREQETWELKGVYRVNLNGKYKPKKVFDPTKTEVCHCFLKPGKFYYSAQTKNDKVEYFVYDIYKETTKKISHDTYEEKRYS